MIAADTNVWARAILGDHPRQSPLARNQLEASRTKEGLFVPLIVLAELAWVLGSAEGWTNSRVLDALDLLLSLDRVEVEAHAIASEALAAAHKGGAGLADHLILGIARARGARTVLTFDRKLGKNPRASLLKV